MSNMAKDKWRNVVMFISACLNQEEDEPNHKIQEQMNADMYKWLMDNYTLTRKKNKVTIFDLMKKQEQ